MRTATLGTSDLTVSAVGLGCNAFGARIDAEQSEAVVAAALDHGITFFDTADTYGFGASEELLGKALGSRRDDVVITTKFGMDMQGQNVPHDGPRNSRAYLRAAVEASLRRLGTDYIDLYQVHQLDLVTPMEEIVEAMNELVDEGKVRHLGCSNFAAWELADATWIARSSGRRPFITAENEYSLYNRAAEEELIPACQRYGVSLLPYFPLAYGLLTGKYRRGQAAPEGSRLSLEKQAHRLAGADFDRIDALESYAAERDLDLVTVALGGLAAQPAVGSIVVGATRPEQVAANVQAASWEPSDDDLAALDDVNRGRAPGMRHASFALR